MTRWTTRFPREGLALRWTATLKTAVLGICLLNLLHAPDAGAATPRLRRLVVVGDSLLAGFGNGGLVARGAMGQRNNAPVLIARRAGVFLPQPLMSSPGVPPPVRIVDDNDNGVLDPGELRRSGGVGFRQNSRSGVRNLAVPAENLTTVFDTIDTEVVARRMARGDAEGRDVMKLLILGLPLRDERVSQITRARDLDPTFLLVWLGSNDVRKLATRTNPAALELSPAEFGTRYRRLLNALADTGAPMAVANLPDVTGIAALRRAAGEVTTCVRGDGTRLPVMPDDLLSIEEGRTTLPEPSCAQVLDAAEQAEVRATVVAYNAEIAAAIADVERDRGVLIAPVDTFTLFDGIRRDGLDVRGDGLLVLTAGYLGGIFGLDGLHPTRTGHAVTANAFIDAINARFGESIPPVDVARVAASDPQVANRFRPGGEPPFNLIPANQDDVLEDAFDDAFDRLGDVSRDLFDDLRDRFERFLDELGDIF